MKNFNRYFLPCLVVTFVLLSLSSFATEIASSTIYSNLQKYIESRNTASGPILAFNKNYDQKMMRSVRASSSLVDYGSYTLLDAINYDSVSSGDWGFNIINYPCSASWYDYGAFYSPYYMYIPAPGGDYALYNNIYSRSWCAGATELSRTFQLSKMHDQSSKVGMFIGISRSLGDGSGIIAAVHIQAYNGSDLVGSYFIGYSNRTSIILNRSIPISSYYLTLPFYEIPCDFVTGSFDRLKVGLYNYALSGYGNTSETIVDHIMISGDSSVEVTSITSNPETLWVDPTGAASGIVFKAITTEPTTVAFTAINNTTGHEFNIGSLATSEKDGENVAQIPWWGNVSGGFAQTGQWTIKASAESSSKEAGFSVEKTKTTYLGLGTWMLKGKDPTDYLPPRPQPTKCPLHDWDYFANKDEGYFANLNVMDPVNVVSGNFSYPAIDLKLKSRRSLTLARIYNSLDHETDAFGKGWSSPYLSHLKITPEYTIFVNSDGSRVLFNQLGNVYTPVGATKLQLAYDDATTFYTLSNPHGTNWIFNQSGQIMQMLQSCCGQGAADAIVFTYDTYNNLDKVISPSGHFLQFTINSDNLITSIVDSTGRTVAYTYDADKQLLTFTNPIGQVTTYSYNADNYLIQITKPGNITTLVEYADRRVSSVIDANGNTSRFAWDYDTRKMLLTDLSGVSHEYGFDTDWVINSYSVPSLALTNNYTNVNTAITGITDSLNNSETYVYNSEKLLDSKTDKLGHATSYKWHPELHKLTKKTDALGREWNYEWCARGNIIKKIDPAGNITAYTYDSHNNRTSVTNALGQVTSYIYDATGNYLSQTIDAMGNISSFTYDVRGNMVTTTDKLGRTTAYEYDLIDRLVKTTYADGRWSQVTYDEAGNMASRMDNLNRETRYSYDLNGKLLSVTYPDNSTSAYVYDASGRKTSSIDALGRVTQYEYNELGNLVKTIAPDGTYQSFNYDTEGRLLSKADELGNVTGFEYDPMGRMVATIDPAGSRWESNYDIVGRKIASKDPLNRITATEYDVLDRSVKTIAPDATFSTSSYDAIGNLLVSTNALNQQTIYEYDGLNRQVKTTAPSGAQFTTSYDAGGQVLSDTNALGNSTEYTYDLAGRRLSVTNALGHISQYFYDNAGRLINTIDAMGGISTMTYDIMDRTIANSDPLGRVSTFEYDVAGRRIAKTDALDRRSIFGYDNRDRLTTEVDGEGHRVSYTYDASGKKLSFTDGAGRIWRWTYDILGRNTSVIDPLGNTDSKIYNAVSNLIAKTNARGQTTTNEFDVMSRLVKINYPDATIATFAYDVLGRETCRSGSAGAVEKTYDIAGNLAKENFVNLNKAWNYTYDLMGNKTQAVSPENQTNSYSHDALGRLLELDTGRVEEKVNYAYDNLGRTIEVKRSGVTTANSFDAASQLLETKHYKLVLDHQSHGCGKKNRHRNRHTPPTYKEEIIALRQYNYDLVGNRINMTDEEGQITSYIYDRSNWLLQALYPNNDVVAYTYNNAGDRLSEQTNSDPAILYSYNAAGRMLTKGDEAFSYDADGNMLTDAVATYTWNSDNRLMKVEKVSSSCKHDKHRKGHGYGHYKHGKADVSYEEYAYLPEDWRRVFRTVGTVKTSGKHTKNEAESFVSIYDGADESHEYEMKKSKYGCYKQHRKHSNLELVKTYISGPGTDDLEFTRSKKEAYSMLKDGLGSTIVLTGKNGKTIARIGYDAWGNFKWSGKAKNSCNVNDYKEYLGRYGKTRGFGSKHHNSWSFGKKFAEKLTQYLYTGRRYSQFTRQYFNRNRYYQPKYGRFTSKDPIGFSGDSNLYRYANDNPVRFTDPWGLFVDMPIDEQDRAKLLLISETFLQTATPDYRLAVKLFQHSLQSSPNNLIFAEGSWQSDYIKQSNMLENEIEKFVYTLPNGGRNIDELNISILLNSPRSYFYAINKAKINIKGSICKVSNAQYDLELDSLIVKDIYDFADMGNRDFYRKKLSVVANQLAFHYQESGVIVPYRWYAKLGSYRISR